MSTRTEMGRSEARVRNRCSIMYDQITTFFDKTHKIETQLAFMPQLTSEFHQQRHLMRWVSVHQAKNVTRKVLSFVKRVTFFVAFQ